MEPYEEDDSVNIINFKEKKIFDNATFLVGYNSETMEDIKISGDTFQKSIEEGLDGKADKDSVFTKEEIINLISSSSVFYKTIVDKDVETPLMFDKVDYIQINDNAIAKVVFTIYSLSENTDVILKKVLLLISKQNGILKISTADITQISSIGDSLYTVLIDCREDDNKLKVYVLTSKNSIIFTSVTSEVITL